MFIDRLPATLVHLRHATTHDVLARWFGVDRSTITRSIAEVRHLLAERGRTVSQDARLRTLAEVIDHLGADGKTGIIDGTKVRVLAPGRRAQGPGQVHLRLEQQNAVKTEHGIAHLKNWRTLARHLCRREHMSDTVQAIARDCCPTNRPQT
ncbi:transposase family protein [Streptomyces sp. DSM 116494]|uniref:helix-turn-helix domain-containing protein n=1 Tax=Streptomyces okerensis TaxID=3344655 RepID=UPI00388D6C20